MAYAPERPISIHSAETVRGSAAIMSSSCRSVAGFVNIAFWITYAST